MENKIDVLSERIVKAHDAIRRADSTRDKYFSPETYELLNALEEHFPSLKPGAKFRVGQVVQFLSSIDRPVKICMVYDWNMKFHRYQGNDGMIYRETELSPYTIEDIS